MNPKSGYRARSSAIILSIKSVTALYLASSSVGKVTSPGFTPLDLTGGLKVVFAKSSPVCPSYSDVLLALLNST
jgi:hypothetical protein